MKYAEIEKGVVVNIAESAYQLKTNWEEIPSQMPVKLGDNFAGGAYYAPDGQMRMTAEAAALNKKLESIQAELRTKYTDEPEQKGNAEHV